MKRAQSCWTSFSFSKLWGDHLDLPKHFSYRHRSFDEKKVMIHWRYRCIKPNRGCCMAIFRGWGTWAGSWGLGSTMAIGTQENGIDMFQCLIAEDHVEMFCPVHGQQVYRLGLAAMPPATELSAACGYSVITILVECSHWVFVGEAVVIDVCVGCGQTHTIQTVYFYTRCWEACQQVT